MIQERFEAPGDQPPAILIEWSALAGRWFATAVVTADLAPIGAEGRSSSRGSSPAAALDKLLGRRFGIMADQDLPASVIAIDRTFVVEEQPA